MTLAQLLEVTVSRKASDLHLLTGFPPMVRIYGELVPVDGTQTLTAEDIPQLLSPVMSEQHRHLFERTFEVDFSFPFENKARFRANVYRQQGQVSAALRMIPLQIPELESLGLPAVTHKLIDLKQGLVLVTGPTGQGKSTTLAAFINKINTTQSKHIISIEDPIEYVYPHAKSLVSQREMYADTRSWSAALRAALREDPDVVLVGEMRDYETIAAAITIAETGHLVFGTLHTNSAAQTLDRILDVFPEQQQPQVKLQLAATLEAIISQRLVPTITPGRTLAVELLLKNAAVSTIIREGKTHLIDNVIQTSAELGMVSLESSLAKLVNTGIITFEMAQNYALRPDLLAKLTNR